MMPSSALVSVTTYVPPEKKDRLRELKEVDHRLTESRIVEDLIDLYLDDYKRRHLHPLQPRRHSPR